MARKRNLFNKGTLSASVGGALTDTTLQSAEFADLPVVTSPDTLTLVLDYDSTSNTPEVVLVTAHSSGATTLTVTRQQETGSGGSAVRSHPINTKWVHPATPLDWDHGNLDGLADDDHPQYVNRTTTQTVGGLKTYTSKQTVSLTAIGVAARIGASGVEDALNITPYGAAAVVYASGAERDGAGDSIARAASATQFEQLNNEFNWYGNTGLTAGATYTRTKRMSLQTTGLSVVGQTHKFGDGALGGTGAYVQIDGTPTEATVVAAGSPADVPLVFRAKGASKIVAQSPGGAVLAELLAGSGQQTSLAVNLASIGVRVIEYGAPDSAGSGYRSLRVAN